MALGAADGNVRTLSGARGRALNQMCSFFVIFVNPGGSYSTLSVFIIGFECGDAESIIATIFIIMMAAPLTVYRMACLQIH
jgi:hypothetical protein